MVKQSVFFSKNLLKNRLIGLINLIHSPTRLAEEISWDKMELELQKLYSEHRRPSIVIRKIADLLVLKKLLEASEELVVEK